MREVPIYRSEKRLVEMEKHLVEKLGEIKLWMMGLSVAQAASLLAIAKGLKWI